MGLVLFLLPSSVYYHHPPTCTATAAGFLVALLKILSELGSKEQ